ncbi:papain family cysteine protease [Ancylostoma ceylanicum]|uniref:Papain family cysteine protease n=1 Tax=Ancylostoma ceylanicum TaxID=53326 RepID=A0A0D6MCT3_9BILA|nr:papain family cysteine protease [Ancylostoma ceylanicum]
MTQSAMDEIALVPTANDEAAFTARTEEPAVHVVTSRTDSRKAKLAKKYQRTPLAFYQARYNKFASRSEVNTGTLSDADTARMILKKFFDLDDEQLLQDTEKHIEGLWRMKLNIPKFFDVRAAWPQCWAVHQIFNQAGCGSCWSVAATSVMSDRVCIHSNGTVQTQISALDLTSCCLSCGGCTYVFPVSLNIRGAFGSHEGCRPYTFEPSCGAPCGSSLYRKDRTPRCERQCQELYHKSYDQDLVQARKAYWLRAINGSAEYTPVVKTTLQRLINGKFTEILQRELMTYGPVLACFTLFEDFQHYMSGIYRTDENRSLQLYGHCAKLMGWGEEGGVKYWLYANTWGRDWGEHGFFRIAMDEIPEEVVAGVM